MPSHASLPAMFFDAASRSQGQTRYLSKVGGTYQPTDWDTFLQRVEAIAAGLLDCGVAAGDRVAILARTRPEWAEAELAALAIVVAATGPWMLRTLVDFTRRLIEDIPSLIG